MKHKTKQERFQTKKDRWWEERGKLRTREMERKLSRAETEEKGEKGEIRREKRNKGERKQSRMWERRDRRRRLCNTV